VVGRDRVVWCGDPDGQFQIGSITKVITSLVLATYVVDGSLGLQQRVGDLLPRLAGPVGEVTLEQLATHTSGLPRIPRELWPRALRGHPDPYADIDHEWLLGSLAKVRPRPSRRPRYSNLGVGLLGDALAGWAGTSYDELVRDRVTAPLGMTATGCVPQEELPGHRRRGTPLDHVWHIDALAGAGALWSTVRDLQAFARAQQDPPVGPLGQAVRLTREPRVRGRRMDQCLGWFRLHGRGGVVWWHSGGTAGYRSFLGVGESPPTCAVVLSASNRSVANLGMLAMKLLAEGQDSGAGA
jgi:CubicO group peptidase (beta-lactamase class C family)